MYRLALSDRSALIRLASTLPVGSGERRSILDVLIQKQAGSTLPELQGLVARLVKKWPDVRIQFSRQKGYYYGDVRQVVDAVRYVADVFSSDFHIQLVLLQDKATKRLVSGPDVWMARPENRMLVGSPIGTAKLQDVDHVLRVIERAVGGLITGKRVEAIRVVAQGLANRYDWDDRAEVDVGPDSISISFWGEGGDTLPGWREGRQWDAEYKRDMRNRKETHDQFLSDLKAELISANVMGSVARIESDGVPTDGAYYSFQIFLK